MSLPEIFRFVSHRLVPQVSGFVPEVVGLDDLAFRPDSADNAHYLGECHFAINSGQFGFELADVAAAIALGMALPKASLCLDGKAIAIAVMDRTRAAPFRGAFLDVESWNSMRVIPANLRSRKSYNVHRNTFKNGLGLWLPAGPARFCCYAALLSVALIPGLPMLSHHLIK